MRVRVVSVEAIGERFVEAFNRRDAEGLVALCDPEIVFHPTVLVGDRRNYRGHDGMRRWVAELETSESKHQVRVREARALDDGFALLTEVLLDGVVVSPSAMTARLGDSGRIEARAYLSDEETLERLGRLDRPS